MSRIGKKPIVVPTGVTVAMDGNTVNVEGPKGKLSQSIPMDLSIKMDGSVLTVDRGSDARTVRALRKPDPYKGKGIKYAEEHIRRKVGKKAGAK